MTDDPAIRRLISQLPSFWHAEAKAQVARSIVTGRTAERMALDSMPPDSLDTEINEFFDPRQRGDQMPMHRYPSSDQRAPTSNAAAMPSSFSDNYVGGSEYRRRDNGADQQPLTHVQVLDFVTEFVSVCKESGNAEECNALLQGIADILDAEMGTATDQGSSLRLPIGNGGEGVSPHELLAPGQGSSRGTFSEEDPVGTGPRGTADNRPRTMRDRRRQAHDTRLAQDADIRRRYANQAGFDQRFGSLVSHVQVWR